METEVKKLYEALFLVDSAEAASDWDGVIQSIEKVLNRVEADIVSIRKWDERPLAYEINRKKRGTYLLVYFNVDGDKISTIERDVQLSERIMRVLILRGDHLTEGGVQKDTPFGIAEKEAEQQAQKKAVAEVEKAAAAETKKKAAEDVQEEAPVVIAENEADPAVEQQDAVVEDSAETPDAVADDVEAEEETEDKQD